MRKGNKGEMRIADSMVWLVIFQLIWRKSFLPSKQTDSQSNHFCKLNSHGHFFYLTGGGRWLEVYCYVCVLIANWCICRMQKSFSASPLFNSQSWGERATEWAAGSVWTQTWHTGTGKWQLQKQLLCQPIPHLCFFGSVRETHTSAYIALMWENF